MYWDNAAKKTFYFKPKPCPFGAGFFMVYFVGQKSKSKFPLIHHTSMKILFFTNLF